MDIPALFDKKKEKEKNAPIDDSTAKSSVNDNVVLGDPLASLPSDDATDDGEKSKTQLDDPENTFLDDGRIVPNETVSTNDKSAVGEFRKTESADITADFINPAANDTEVSTPESSNLPESLPESTIATPVLIKKPEDDPEKIAFIKTYTQEFDDTLNRAINAAQKVLDSIDEAVREHLSDISVPDEANEFLDEKPENNSVQKFEDARAIVRIIMSRATDAREQSAQAATEAAKIYEEVQDFKRETKQQIAQLIDDHIDA